MAAPDPTCFELAVRRKAFARALRLQAALDVTAVARHLESSTQQTRRPTRRTDHETVNEPKAG